MDVIEQLIIEHRVVEGLLARLDIADRAGRNLALVDLTDALSTHMEVEERRLHPIIEARLGRGESIDADAAHDNMRHVLSKLFELADDDARFVEALDEMRSDFASHAAAEEGELFPTLRRSAAAALADLGTAAALEESVKSELAVEGLGGNH